MQKDLHPIGTPLIARVDGRQWSRGARAIVVARRTYPIDILQFRKAITGVLFQSGAYEEFSPGELRRTFLALVNPKPGLAGYRFEGLRPLVRDFHDGRFSAAFPGHRLEAS